MGTPEYSCICIPTTAPTTKPTAFPLKVITYIPTSEAPTISPTVNPTYYPSINPSTNSPTNKPSNNPTNTPSEIAINKINTNRIDAVQTNSANPVYADLMFPISLVVSVGACALCSVVLVILRQLLTKRNHS